MKTLSCTLNRHCAEILDGLVRDETNFSMFCCIHNVKFNPALPKDISDGFSPVTMFILSGYTFQSIELSKSGIEFEAGFGAGNIPSLVYVDYKGIVQISIKQEGFSGEMIIFSNPIALYSCSESLATEKTEFDRETLISSSRDAILSNPDNVPKR